MPIFKGERRFTTGISGRLMLAAVISLLGMVLLLSLAMQVLHGEILRERVEKSRALSDVARGILSSYHEKAKAGLYDEAAAKAAAIAEIRNLRYQNNEYFFIYDEDGICILLPTLPEREGGSFLDIKDPHGVAFIKELIDSAGGDGHPVFYQFPRGGSNGPIDKVAVGKIFEPWRWMIGSGVYIDDVEADFDSILFHLSIIPVVVALVTGVAILLVARSVSAPLSRLTAAMTSLSNRDYAVDVPFDERADEIGAIARAMAVFKENGKAMVALQRQEQDRIAEIEEAHRKLSLQVSLMPFGYIVWSDLVVAEWNPAAERIFGWSADEAIGRRASELIVPAELVPKVDSLREHYLRSGYVEPHLVGDNVTKDGRRIVCEWFNAPVRDAAGNVVGCLSMVQDITARRLADDRLRESEERLTVITENAPGTIWMVDRAGHITYANRGTAGISRRNVVGTAILDWVAEEFRPIIQQALRETFQSGTPAYREFMGRGEGGGDRWYSTRMGPIFEGERIVGAIFTTNDVTDRKIAEARIEYLAHHDALTGLPNRILGKTRFDLTVAHAERTQSKVAMLFLDFDSFKRVNESFGHAAGDAMLKSVADRLSGCVSGLDTIVHPGGDQFLILLTDVHGTDDIINRANKIIEELQSPFDIDGEEITTSVSLGAAVYPDDGTTYEELFKKADAAVSSAKDAGRNTYRFFTPQMNADAAEYLRIRTGLRRALEGEELVLHFQPQFDLATGSVIGAEALIRWAHPDLGLLSPGHFITVAEDSGLIVPIGEWVLREACRQAVAWQASGLPPISVAVNLSAVQFKRGDLFEVVERALADTGCDPRRLELEMTESALLRDTSHVMTTVERLRDLGVAFSIDDFGTGYSSLAYLRQFKVDKLKIDQSFVRQALASANDAAIVRAIIQLARSLGLCTVAEGIENQAVLDSLRAWGCDQAQGYHLGRPMAVPAFIDHLRNLAPSFQFVE